MSSTVTLGTVTKDHSNNNNSDGNNNNITSRHSNQLIVDSKVSSFYIRTLCSYEPYLDKGLPGKGLKFKPGDLLFVSNANDDRWWQAVPLPHRSFIYSASSATAYSAGGGSNLQLRRGLIPSLSRVQNKSYQHRRHVEFDNKAVIIDPHGRLNTETISNWYDQSSGGSNSFDLRRLRKYQDTTHLNKQPIRADNLQSRNANSVSDFIHPYEKVEWMKLPEPRPIVIIGPGKDNIYQYLLSCFPEKFTSPIPHTTRAPRPDEKHGVDYYFVKSIDQTTDDSVYSGESVTNNINQSNSNQFIDIGKYKGYYYASSLESIRQCSSNNPNKHSLLHISHNGIEKLRSGQIYPICVLINPLSLVICKQLQANNPQLTKFSPTDTSHVTPPLSYCSTNSTHNLDITSLKEYTNRLCKDFQILFDEIISPTSLQDLLDCIQPLIDKYQSSATWARADSQIFS